MGGYFICLQIGEWESKSPESYLLKLQGDEAKYLGQSVSSCVRIFGLGGFLFLFFSN